MPRITILISLILFSVQSPQAQPSRSNPVMQRYTLIADSLVRPELERLSLFYKMDTAMLATFDKIITLNREVYVGKIHNITYSEVRFTNPFDNVIHALNRSGISQILYASGKRDVFIPLDDVYVKQKELVDTGRIIIRNQKDWMKVIVTGDPDAVADLKAFGKINTRYEADIGSMNNEELMRHACVALKKKAAAMRAHCVLVDTKFFLKPYGELPVVEVTAWAFGYR